MTTNSDPAQPGGPSGQTVRVYIDGRGVDVAAGAPVLDAVARLDAALADAVRGGQRALTDSRGLPVAADAPAYGGAIFRVVSARAARAAAAESSGSDDAAH